MPQSSTPLVEIFIPTYNRASFISQAIDSALGQDYPNVSVVVMDNCSTDNTAEVLARYSDRPNFRVITHERNLGANANFNQCVARRQRDAYFTTLADDDAFLPHFVSTMLKGFSAFPDVDIVGARYLLAQDSLENIVERPQRSNATPRLVPAREIIEDTVLHMGAYMARPG